MKHYLDLVPISAKVHRRQSRMTVLCIVISVVLVTAIFSLAEAFLKMELSSMTEKHGGWHFKVSGLSQQQEADLSAREDVLFVGESAAFNEDGSEPYRVEDSRAVLYGIAGDYLVQYESGVTQGTFPQKDDEVLLSPNAAEVLGVTVGDTVTVTTPAGGKTFTVVGMGTDDPSYYQNQTYLIGVYLTKDAFDALLTESGTTPPEPDCYVQCTSAKKAAALRDVLKQDESLHVEENVAVMGLLGLSARASMRNIYDAAAVLFVLVLAAGVLMISGSMNSNVAQRTQFFGMLRCIGASKAQIIRFVRLEALNWCKTAIPLGLLLGTLASWTVCAVLRYGIGGEWETMPVVMFSPVGVGCGIVVGLVTVLLAAQAPAKRAASVPPMTAVSGNVSQGAKERHGVRFGTKHIEIALGVHHATAAKKNWALMTASFALSIVLFFAFHVLLDFAQFLMPSMAKWKPDLGLIGYDNALTMDNAMLQEIQALPGVKWAYGITFFRNTPAESSREGVEAVSLAAYDETMLKLTKDDLAQGTVDGAAGDNGLALTVFDRDNPLRVGDTVTVNGVKLTICGALTQGIAVSERAVICSPQTLERIMGKQNYNMIGVQLEQNAPQETVEEIKSYQSDEIVVEDSREPNQKANASFYATRIGVYSFLGMLAVITLFNIINSISMSVTAQMKQYGAMRAVGMDSRQLIWMVAAEALTDAVSGLIVGSIAGMAVSRQLYGGLVTGYFGKAWTIPWGQLGVAAAFILLASMAAIVIPAQRIKKMEICETLNTL